jgi:uncharacterized membrane protein (DUF4010 family)
MLSVYLGSFFPAIGFAGVFVLALAFYYFRAARVGYMPGITTAMMIPFAFVLGMLVGYSKFFEAGACAIITAMMLAERSQLHAAVRTLSRKEVIDGLLLAIIAFIIYPLLPAEPLALMGQSIDLRYFWSVVILVSFMTYAGHMLVKYYRTKALAYAAFFGGVVSSLAVVSLFARSTKKTDYALLRFGFTSSSAGSVAGDILLLGVLGTSLLVKSLLPLVFVFLAFLLFSFVYRKGVSKKGLPVFEEPLSLKFALEFALIYFVVRLVIGYVSVYDSVGVLAFSFLSGLVSTTSVFASLVALFANGTVNANEAMLGMLLAVFGSLVAKSNIMLLKVKSEFWSKLLPPIVGVIAAGLLGYWLQLTFM